MLGRLAVSAALVLTLCKGAKSQERKQGTIEVRDHCSVSLHQENAACIVTLDGDGSDPPVDPSGKEFDFWYKMEGHFASLRSMNGTMFAVKGDGSADLTGCSRAEFSRRPIRIDKLPIGSHICVRSRNGGMAGIEVTHIDQKRASASIEYVIWQ